MRATRTQRLLAGATNVRPEDCLFIDPTGIPPKTLRGADEFRWLSRSGRRRRDTGHIVVDKQPKTQEGVSTRLPSPDLFDGLVMSYSSDFDDNKGLTTRR